MKNSIIVISLLAIVSCNSRNTEITNKIRSESVFNYGDTNIKNKKAYILFDSALSMAESNKYPEARDLLGQANKIEPNNLDIINSTGNVKNALHQFDSAIYFYNLSLSIDSSYLYTYTNYGYAFSTYGRYQDALNIYFMGLKHKKDTIGIDMIYINIACAYRYIGNCDEAKKYAELSVSRSKNSSRSMRNHIIEVAKYINENCN